MRIYGGKGAFSLFFFVCMCFFACIDTICMYCLRPGWGSCNSHNTIPCLWKPNFRLHFSIDCIEKDCECVCLSVCVCHVYRYRNIKVYFFILIHFILVKYFVSSSWLLWLQEGQFKFSLIYIMLFIFFRIYFNETN